MDNHEFQAWLKQRRESGLSDEETRKQLLADGWTNEQIETALAPTSLVAEKEISESAVNLPIGVSIADKPAAKSISKQKILWIAAIGGVIVLLIGGAVFAYLKGYLQLPFLTPKADEILLKSLDQLIDVKGGDFGFTFRVAAEERGPGAKPFSWKTVAGESPMAIKSKNAKIAADVKQIQTALELYYADQWADDSSQGVYPAGANVALGGKDAACLSDAGFGAACNGRVTYMGVIPKHPDDKPYVYTANADLKGYTIEFQYIGTPDPTPVKVTEASEFPRSPDQSSDTFDAYAYLTEGLDVFINYIPADLDLRGSASAFMGKMPEDKKMRSGIVKLAGSYASGGTALSTDIESRMKDGKIYVLVRKIPSFFFFDFSAFQNKWIVIDPESDDSAMGFIDFEDYEEFSNQFNKEEDAKAIRDELPHIARLAIANKVFVATLESTEKLESGSAYRIRVNLNPDQFPAFVEAYRSDAQSRNFDLSKVDNLLNNLKDPRIIEQAKESLQNTVLTFWVDKSTYAPKKLEYSIVLVPPERAEKLKAKQFRLTLGMTFAHLNEEPNVEVPSETISLDEVERLMAGMSVEEYELKKQRENVSAVRSALRNYFDVNNKYPDSLSQLLEKPPAEDSKYSWTRDYENYFYYDRKKAIPSDLYSNQPFGYESKVSDYALTYTIKVPTETSEERSPSLFYFGDTSYYRSQYVEGRNTATKDFLSREVEGVKDDDGDGLTNEEEIRYGTETYSKDSDYDGLDDKKEIQAYGTDPLKADTDGDGYNDGDEVKNGYDPLTAVKKLYSIDCPGGPYDCDLVFNNPTTKKSSVFIKDILNQLRDINPIRRQTTSHLIVKSS